MVNVHLAFINQLTSAHLLTAVTVPLNIPLANCPSTGPSGLVMTSTSQEKINREKIQLPILSFCE